MFSFPLHPDLIFITIVPKMGTGERLQMAESNQVLKALFTSESRIALLAYFFLHPEESFYLRQLERLLKKPVGQLSRELLNLEKIGLLVSSQEGNQRRYTVNKDFPLHDELRTVFLKTAGAGDVIRGALSKLEGVELALVYGSFAKGEEHSGSDIDVMIVGTVADKDVGRTISTAERKLKRPVNYSLYEREEVMARLKRKDNFIMTVFGEPHIVLIGSKNDRLFRTR